MIKFGSRTDVLIPADAVPRVRTGMRVKGGSTVLAVVPAATRETHNHAASVVS
jgi:phosphatidylserine decarboxylase